VTDFMGVPAPGRIMIVEDERIVALDVGGMVRRLGHEVCAVTASGEEALRLFPGAAPDLVLMDIMLEGELDGVETSRRLRGLRDIPVIFASAYSDEVTRLRAFETGPSAFLVKPLDIDSLGRAIRRALKTARPPLDEPRRS